MRKSAILSAILFAFPLFAQEKGTITGKVHLLEKGKQTQLAGTPVRLKIYKNDQMVAGGETKTDARGVYAFPQQDRKAGFRYKAEALYKGVPFAGTFSFFRGASTLELSPIAATPVTGKPTEIISDDILIFEFGKNNVIKATHSVKLLNRADSLYDSRAEGGEPISISLPKGSFRLERGNGLDSENSEIDEKGNRLLLKVPVTPGPLGELKLEYSFLYTYEHRSTNFVMPISVERKRFSLVLAEQDYRVKSSMLSPQESQKISGIQYHYYMGGPFRAGEDVQFTISGLPMPKDLPRGLALGGCIFALLGVGSAVFRKKQKARNLGKKELIDLWVEMENHHRGGRLSLSEYRDQRERLTQSWIELK